MTASDGVTRTGNDFHITSEGLRTGHFMDKAVTNEKLNTITTANKIHGSAVQLFNVSAIENTTDENTGDSTGLRLKNSLAGTGLTETQQVLSCLLYTSPSPRD